MIAALSEQLSPRAQPWPKVTKFPSYAEGTRAGDQKKKKKGRVAKLRTLKAIRKNLENVNFYGFLFSLCLVEAETRAVLERPARVMGAPVQGSICGSEWPQPYGPIRHPLSAVRRPRAEVIAECEQD
ncbi:uncharacterized protein VTP21DRAFT_974 [Calcarisporiella thermophila]|uniref:uncharacterized protein n=1 Tax=Calcarisporiella thermophila TaxID=911321 RepID=UPI0037439AAC